MGSTVKIDKTDRKIIEMLTQNARFSLREIAAVVKMSPSSVRNRMESLLDLGVIKRYTLDVDHRKIGFEIQVVVLVTSKPSESDRLNLALKGYHEITEVLRTSGPARLADKVRPSDTTGAVRTGSAVHCRVQTTGESPAECA